MSDLSSASDDRDRRERLKGSFGAASESYNAARPDYSAQAVEEVFAIAGVGQNDAILEIGCGSGQATLPFARHGNPLLAIDLSGELVAKARMRLAAFPSVRFAVGAFEDASLPDGHFRLAIAAQSFHWIDPAIGYAKVHRALADGGHFALLWNFQDKSAPLEQDVRALYATHCPDFRQTYGSTDRAREKLARSGLFEEPQERTHSRTLRYTKASYLSLLRSFSWVSTLDADAKERFFADVDTLLAGRADEIMVPTETKILVARKRAPG